MLSERDYGAMLFHRLIRAILCVSILSETSDEKCVSNDMAGKS
jgi:hypothetical protein